MRTRIVVALLVVWAAVITAGLMLPGAQEVTTSGSAEAETLPSVHVVEARPIGWVIETEVPDGTVTVASPSGPRLDFSTVVVPTDPGPASGGYDPWRRVRDCESTNNYAAINWVDTDGTASYGGYQFKQGTWNWVVEYGGRPELSGVRPDHAAPADQDWAAEVLRTMPQGGLGHWPYCGRYYGS